MTEQTDHECHECPECAGEGYVEVYCGYRQYGMGYGDCEEVYEVRECARCHTTGFLGREDIANMESTND